MPAEASYAGGVTRHKSPLYTGALLASGAFGVHQLRYLLAYGDDADHALAASGHKYLSLVEPLIGLLLAFAAGHLLHRIAHTTRRAVPLERRRMAVMFAFALIAVFTGQELLEAQLAAGHGGVFSHGGWIAFPLALAIGGVLSLAVRAAAVATPAAVVRHGLRLGLVRSPLLALAPRPRPVRAPSPLLARHLAGRAPPLLPTS